MLTFCNIYYIYAGMYENYNITSENKVCYTKSLDKQHFNSYYSDLMSNDTKYTVQSKCFRHFVYEIYSYNSSIE